jgi:hypothetical protein
MTTRRPYAKYFDRGLRQWIYKTARKNMWRVAHFYELSDLIQDGFLCYAICRERYGHKVEGQRHFMSLCQTVYRNHITDLANDRSNAPKETPISQFARKNPATSDSDLLEMIGGYEQGDAEMAATLQSASAEIRAMMRALSAEPDVAKVVVGALRLTTNQTLNAVIGTFGMDFEGQLRGLLGLPKDAKKVSPGYTFDGNLEEVKQAPWVCLSTAPKQYRSRKVYTVERGTFRMMFA